MRRPQTMQTCESPSLPVTSDHSHKPQDYKSLKALHADPQLYWHIVIVQCTVPCAHWHGICGTPHCANRVLYPHMLQPPLPAAACTACKGGRMKALMVLEQISLVTKPASMRCGAQQLRMHVSSELVSSGAQIWPILDRHHAGVCDSRDWQLCVLCVLQAQARLSHRQRNTGLVLRH